MNCETTTKVCSESERICRGQVFGLLSAGEFLVQMDDGGQRYVRCDSLATATGPLMLSIGDQVLVLSSQTSECATILGRIYRSSETVSDGCAGDVAHCAASPSTLLLEATEELTLRVGDGSITIRKDGKILIKGTDLVSSAKRMNRVKGGAVAIN